MDKMSRSEFFLKFITKFKQSIKLPAGLEFKEETSGQWVDLTMYEPENGSEYRIVVFIGQEPLYIADKAFDKALSGFVPEYTANKSTVLYSDVDIDISINNLRHLIMGRFAEKYLYQNVENNFN